MAVIFQTARFELDALMHSLAQYLSGRILDVGAGSYDRYSHYFKATDYVRLDIEQRAHVDLVGTAEAIPAPDASFDGIVCTQVLGDIFDVRVAVGEFRRVLKSGGRVILSESLMDPLHDLPHDYWRFTSYGLEKLFTEQGFAILDSKKYGGYHSVLAQFRTRYWISRYHLMTAWYGRYVGFLLKLLNWFALWRDAHDATAANRAFAHGWVVVAQKK